MKNMKMVAVIVGMLLLAGGAEASAKVMRATEMGSVMWSDLSHGKLSDVIIEFRQGDELPVSFAAEGDLIETKRSSVSYIGIKRNFWISLSQNDLKLSLDGVNFKKFSDLLTGSLEAGAGSDQNGGVANSINIVFKAFLK